MNTRISSLDKWENKEGDTFYCKADTQEFYKKARYSSGYFYSRYDNNKIYHGSGETMLEAKTNAYELGDCPQTRDNKYNKFVHALTINELPIPHLFDKVSLVREVKENSEFLVVVNRAITVYYVITAFGVIGKMGRNAQEAEAYCRKAINALYEYPAYLRPYMLENTSPLDGKYHKS